MREVRVHAYAADTHSGPADVGTRTLSLEGDGRPATRPGDPALWLGSARLRGKPAQTRKQEFLRLSVETFMDPPVVMRQDDMPSLQMRRRALVRGRVAGRPKKDDEFFEQAIRPRGSASKTVELRQGLQDGQDRSAPATRWS
jgi:hypothetical protein